MLLIAGARGVGVSKCFSQAKLPAKRLASLTGAIQRGVRKAKDVQERTERYNSGSNFDVDADSRSDFAKGARKAAPFEHEYGRRPQAPPRLLDQRRESRRGQEGKSKYPQSEEVLTVANRQIIFHKLKETDG